MSESVESLLIKSKPYLAIYFAGADETEGSTASGPRFQIDAAKNGEPIVYVTNADENGATRPAALASRYDPGKDAARTIAALGGRPIRGTDIVLVLGLGNPVILSQLTPMLGEKQICLAVDAHLELGRRLCAEDPDTLRYLARPGCHLFAGDELLASLRSYIEGLPAERLSGLRVLRHPASLRLAQEFYEAVEAEIRDIIKSKMSDLLTRFEFEQLWLKNILINSRYLPPGPAGLSAAIAPSQPAANAEMPGVASGAFARPGEQSSDTATVSAFANALKGVPGLLVSAGPSLRDSLELIALAKSRAFILACDTALKPLLKASIKPHAVVTLDAQRHTLFAFQGTQSEDTVLFADLVSNPAVLRQISESFKGLVFSTTAQVSYSADGTLHREVTPGTEHAELIHGTVGAVQSGGSVATSGFDLLRGLGCDPICIVGQDLAYTGRRIHTVGTHHQERWLPALSRTRSLEHIVESVVRKRKTQPVSAIRRGTGTDAGGQGDETVLGDYVLNLYRLWFDQSIPAVENRVVNLSAAGQPLEGAEHPADPEAFVRGLPEISDPGAIFARIRPPQRFEHPRNNQLQSTLGTLLERLDLLERDERRASAKAGEDDSEINAKADEAGALIEAFFEAYPYLRPLIRRSEVYLKRNREKLGEDRARRLAQRNAIEAFRGLWRSLRPYFQEGSS